MPDPGTGQNYSPEAGVYNINGCFNRVWNDNPNLRPDIQRSIDLRNSLRQGDGTASCRLIPIRQLDSRERESCRAASKCLDLIKFPVRTMEESFAIRGPRRTLGPDQYKINYVDVAEPDYTIMGVPPPPPTYDPTNLTSAVIQPRFKAGYIQLNSDPNAPIPNGDGTPGTTRLFQVFYKFQFTHPSDAFAVDYDSRQVMSINLTIRTFPQSNFPNAAGIAVKTSAIVRNFIR